MKASELREKTAAELQEILIDLRKEQFNLRMQQGTGQLSRPHLMQDVKKDIARVHTVMNENAGGES
jgi:large subunit ribosomal protein L29